MEIPWLQSLVESWQAGRSQGRSPHAIMLTGVAGTGKRAAAAWLARQQLGIEPLLAAPSYPLQVPEHADLRWLTIPEDKHAIGIEQIRTLVGELSLTSYEGGGKVAVIEPADAMTISAANGLLKTLEEPPGDALLVLVVDRPGRLPATVASRCQRLNIAIPDEDVALRWLQAVQPGASWHKALLAAGNAPLAAVAALQRIDDTDAMAGDFAALADGKAAPLAVAGKWSKYEPEFVLAWLSRQVQRCIVRAVAGSSAHSAGVPESVLARMDRRNLFCYLDMINRLRGQAAGSFNVQLTLECLLIDWADGLRSVTGPENTR